jgi:hypothetical protein
VQLLESLAWPTPPGTLDRCDGVSLAVVLTAANVYCSKVFEELVDAVTVG